MFTTRATRMSAVAPAAALTAAGVTDALRRLPMITPCAPAHSALRMMEPRLCGSSTPSSTMTNGASPRCAAQARMSSTPQYSMPAA